MMEFWIDGVAFTAVAGADSFVLNRIGFLAPKRDYDSIAIPGRNGELTVDNGRYHNTDGYYQCFIQEGYKDKIGVVQDWLSTVGYHRLEDIMEPNVYRMARYTGMDEKKVKDNNIARFDLKFDLAPQKWLKSGEETVTLSANGTLHNPTRHNAQPKITLSGNGTLTINGNTVTIADNTGEIILDSEICRAYSGTTAKDNLMTGAFPELIPGENTVSFTGFSSVDIEPRWWTL